MSGRTPAKPGPVVFTQEEVDALAGGRRPASVTRRLKAVRTLRAQKTRRATTSDTPAPPPLKRSELAALRSARPAPAVRKRLFSASESTEPAPPRVADGGAAKPYPSQQIPTGRSTRG
jgi:hypothetical protein